ncbi:hypothetical protein [Pseudobacteriovorax antillogorgiicola]|uniref:Uncharacterized protein n=1 Tax=Pseudobacteriovorax antillogorgiicola TaxID=1513793 RepID=A0A1Y6CQF4_9BACT|nr:hypothetical protein [Pseudobacteriovorax antillogorgiicola]TCS51634.1 hypothetical protein EDD56_11018 [Pseudobacteriovorax antillogorgiicola]SMF81587.1 hypothetical protein SAMN06296036_13718 [Pseudobacteriovorax antillogorgiicola]
MIIRKAIESSYWAMRKEGLSSLIASANGEGDFKALEKHLGEKPKYTYRATVRDGIGIIPISGPLFKKANLLTEVCGATSYELVLRDLHGFVEDDSIRLSFSISIVLAAKLAAAMSFQNISIGPEAASPLLPLSGAMVPQPAIGLRVPARKSMPQILPLLVALASKL